MTLFIIKLLWNSNRLKSYFPIGPILCLVCLSLLWIEESKIWAFFALTFSFKRPQKEEKKITTTPQFFGQENKLRSNFVEEKLIEFLFFYEVLTNFIFSNCRLKSWLYNANIEIQKLICGYFIAKYLNLWSSLKFLHFEKLLNSLSACGGAELLRTKIGT